MTAHDQPATPALTSPVRPPVRVHKGHEVLTSLDRWGELAGPQSADQWKPDRSAMTCAERWLAHAAAGGPPEVLAALEGHPGFREIVLEDVEPELAIRFDTRRGNTRCTDLAVRAHDGAGTVAVLVEAKADESFGETVAQALAAGRAELARNERSGKLGRVEDLLRACFGTTIDAEPALGELRYQLLTASAGAVSWALQQGATRALLLVHEFVTPATTDPLHAANARDLDAFLTRVSGGAIRSCPAGVIVGPLCLPGAPLFAAHAPALFVGKAVYRRR